MQIRQSHAIETPILSVRRRGGAADAICAMRGDATAMLRDVDAVEHAVRPPAAARRDYCRAPKTLRPRYGGIEDTLARRAQRGRTMFDECSRCGAAKSAGEACAEAGARRTAHYRRYNDVPPASEYCRAMRRVAEKRGVPSAQHLRKIACLRVYRFASPAMLPRCRVYDAVSCSR